LAVCKAVGRVSCAKGGTVSVKRGVGFDHVGCALAGRIDPRSGIERKARTMRMISLFVAFNPR
jgi:hypothetical protein